jgi:hypothetical protein
VSLVDRTGVDARAGNRVDKVIPVDSFVTVTPFFQANRAIWRPRPFAGSTSASVHK